MLSLQQCHKRFTVNNTYHKELDSIISCCSRKESSFHPSILLPLDSPPSPLSSPGNVDQTRESGEDQELEMAHSS